MAVLEVKGLKKIYPTFTLNNVSFALQEGKITGFIGRNGAGKSTTLNSLFNFVHPDDGEVNFWGENINENETKIKQKVGFVSSGVNYYPNKKLKIITSVTKSFYPNWDENAYQKYMKSFGLDENKTPKQLSMGMKIKYAIVLALSHKAELLILDEPTSGLDPVSRDELLDIFIDLSDKGKTILFSTHITSDLEKCADNIIYIKNGEILADMNMDEFVNGYKVVEYEKGQLDEKLLIGAKRSKNGMSALVKTDDVAKLNCEVTNADLDSIMIHLERGEEE
jgi:ABC-2 type transport system ATP-binding protein